MLIYEVDLTRGMKNKVNTAKAACSRGGSCMSVCIGKMENQSGLEAHGRLGSLLEKFETVSLEEIDKVSLLKRAETKYLMDAGALFEILEELPEHYKMLKIGNNRKNSYQTLYYDTPSLEMYRQHHNGIMNRCKVRTREYLDTNLSFTEVKFKDNKSVTTKKRIKRTGNERGLPPESIELIQESGNLDFDELVCVMRNTYSRITLVHKNDIERITIDIDLEFFNDSGRNIRFDNLVIVEIKQEKFSQNSDFVRLMHKKMIRPTSFSKYCIGVSLLYEGVKANNFKENLLLINKLTGGAEI